MSGKQVVQKFCVSTTAPDLTATGVEHYHWKKYGPIFVTRVHADYLVMDDVSSRADLIANHNIEWLPGLATPVASLSARVQAFIASEGLTILATDQLLHVLRKLRNKYDGNFGFDISPTS